MKDVVLKVENLNAFYGPTQALNNINLTIERHKVIAIIGPSGCGKSTLLRTLNRMNDFEENFRIQGKILYQNKNIYNEDCDAVEVRKNIGMVFQKPNPFPQSIAKNILWGPKINRLSFEPQELMESCLKEAGLFEEVKDRLNSSALELSGGQQQRLCIARTLAMKPEVVLMDEPCSSLDPKSTARIEELISDLKKSYTILIVTHNMQQALRCSDQTAFIHKGRLIEFGPTEKIFNSPVEKKTKDYTEGKFG